MKHLKPILVALSLVSSVLAQAEDTITCDGAKTQLVRTDDNRIQFSSRDYGSSKRIVKTQYSKKNSYGNPDRLDVTVDNGSDSAYLIFQFNDLLGCEGDTTLKIIMAPHFDTPRIIKEAKCVCRQS